MSIVIYFTFVQRTFMMDTCFWWNFRSNVG